MEVERLVAAIKEEAGRLDVLVNNAGCTRDAATPTLALEDYDAVAGADAWHVVPHRSSCSGASCCGSRRGRIINVTSVVGHTGNPGQAPYTMAKAGLDALTKTLAQELAGRDHPGQLGRAWLHRDRHDGGRCRPAVQRARSSRACRSGGWGKRRRSPTPSPSWRRAAVVRPRDGHARERWPVWRLSR